MDPVIFTIVIVTLLAMLGIAVYYSGRRYRATDTTAEAQAALAEVERRDPEVRRLAAQLAEQQREIDELLDRR